MHTCALFISYILITGVNDGPVVCTMQKSGTMSEGRCCCLLWIGVPQCLSVWSPFQRTCDILVVCSVSWHNKVYGCETRILKPSLQTSLDGCNTRMLHAVLNIDHNEYVTNKHQYEGQPGLSEKAASRRMRLAGQGQRHWELPAIELVLWDPTPTQVEVLWKDI